MKRRHEDEKANWLLERLMEDTQHPHLADHFLDTATAIHDLPRPPINPARKARLTLGLIQAHRAHVAGKARMGLNPLEWWAVLLLVGQARVVERAIWAASALALAVGAAVTIVLDRAVSMGALPFALAAPIVAALGIAFLTSSESDSAGDIERGTAASYRLIWLARLALVFGFDLIAGVAASLALGLVDPRLAAWPLVMTWLAPMALLSALAFLISVWRGDAATGALTAMALWGAQVARMALPKGLALAEALPDLLAAETRLAAAGIAIALAALGLWLVGRESLPATATD